MKSQGQRDIRSRCRQHLFFGILRQLLIAGYSRLEHTCDRPVIHPIIAQRMVERRKFRRPYKFLLNLRIVISGAEPVL